MKKTLVYGVATAAVLVSIGGGITATQCSPVERVETVYGPPPEISSSVEIDEPIEDVYGPPLVEDEDAASSSNGNVDDDDEDLVAALYGPPPED